MADEGLPISCETDINGAVTLAMLQAVTLGKESSFLADLTIRHPQNDNAELLWHCGPFPYSLKDSGCQARLVGGQERFELKKGDITVCRFDDCDGKYYLFGGEGRAVDGPQTNGTYVWFETDNWKRWEEKLMFGPTSTMWAAFTATTSPSCGRPRAISASSSTTPTSRAFTVCEGGTCYERDTSPGPGPGGVPALRRLMDLLRVPQIERREGDNILPRTF